MIRYQASPAHGATTTQVPSPSCRMALIDRMASDMREMAFAGQNVSTETLVQRGWTAPVIKRLSSEAIDRARRLSTRRQG